MSEPCAPISCPALVSPTGWTWTAERHRRCSSTSTPHSGSSTELRWSTRYDTAVVCACAAPTSRARAGPEPVDTTVVADVVIVVVFRVLAAIAIAVIATVISLRFLGIRRGWGTALLAGLIGWGGAGALALALNHWDWGADGLAIHVFAIAVPATMATAVALDLLARPGSLAIGERAGLVTAPRPFRAIRRRGEGLRGDRELVRLPRREGFCLPAGGGRGDGSPRRAAAP